MSYQDYIDRMNQELLDDLLGRGAGDPDTYGYPGEDVMVISPMILRISMPPSPLRKLKRVGDG